jgi:hypothetical protein
MFHHIRAFHTQNPDIVQAPVGGDPANGVDPAQEPLDSHEIAVRMSLGHGGEKRAFPATDVHLQGTRFWKKGFQGDPFEKIGRDILDLGGRLRERVAWYDGVDGDLSGVIGIHGQKKKGVSIQGRRR